MSVGQFFLGLVTIIVATVIYRWQKMIERETVLQNEQRALFARYTSITRTHYLSQPFKGQEYSPEYLQSFFSISDSEKEIYAVRDQIFLLASPEVFEAVRKHDEAFRAWKVSFPEANESDPQKIETAKNAAKAYLTSHDQLLVVMRTDLAGHHRFKMPWQIKNQPSKP